MADTVSDDTFEDLMLAVMHEADLAAINEQFKPGVTPAAITRAAVKAAFRVALLNKLIVVRDPDCWPHILDRLPPE